jgi:hypothetical protein
MKTLRKIESLYGTGRLWQGDNNQQEVHYNLEVWQEYLDETTPGMVQASGNLTMSSPTAAFDIMLGDMGNLQLELKDGRRVSITPQNANIDSNRLPFKTSGSIK